jgi:hypothetical protein
MKTAATRLPGSIQLLGVEQAAPGQAWARSRYAMEMCNLEATNGTPPDYAT